ncbi:MAG: 16S rRNA (uracil(1498)-N(3))-methyltransferase [Tenericutes bacterium]|nr:16S rRNA (uracil(1498)-N(3))-methyltransferase [Mycoplasmatota bacterium]
MQQYFGVSKEKDTIKLNTNDLNHIKNVMRMKENDNIIVVYDEVSYICSLKYDLLSANIIKVFKEKTSINSLIAYIPLLSEEKMSFILQHGTELGVTEFIVVLYSHCKYKLKEKDFEKKLTRWSKIVKEASEQCYRTDIPNVNKIIKVNEIEKHNGVNILCSLVNEDVKNITKVLTVENYSDTISVVFGPEGGLTTEEELAIEKLGFIKTSLGQSVLRSETVILFVASILRYLKESDLNGKL